jgi:hypothetical protein
MLSKPADKPPVKNASAAIVDLLPEGLKPIRTKTYAKDKKNKIKLLILSS